VKRLRFQIFAFLPVALLITFSCGGQDKELTDITCALDSLEHKLAWLDGRLALENWSLLTTGESDSLAFYQQLYDWVVADRETFDFLHAARDRVRNEIDNRRLEILYPAFLAAQVQNDKHVRSLRDSLVHVLSSYQAELHGQPSSRAHIESRFYYDSQRANREQAYVALNLVGEEIADDVARLFRLRNRAAQRLGYRDYFTMVLDQSELPLDEYLSLLQHIDSLTSEPYRKLIEQIRNRLHVQEVEIWDIPFSYSSVFREVDQSFQIDSQMYRMKYGLRELGFDLDKLPVYIRFEYREEGPPFAVALIVHPPYDQRVVGYWSHGLPAARAAVQEIAFAVQMSFVHQSQLLFCSVRDGAWLQGMASIFADILDRDEWLRTYTGISDELLVRYRKARCERDLVNIRLSLVQLFFEYEAYRDPDRNLNRLYWNLFNELMALPRHDGIKPWAAEAVYITRPVSSQNYLLGDIISAQTLAYLERYNGSIVGNPETRAFLVQNYFRFGSRFHWRDLLERGTGEPLQPKYLLERMGIACR